MPSPQTYPALAIPLPLLPLALVLCGCPVPDDDEGTVVDGSGTAATTDTSGTTDAADETGTTGATPIECDGAEVAGTVVEHSGVTTGEHWAVGIHRVSGLLSVEGPLSVEPCSIIEMEDGASIVVAAGGSLQWSGTADAPITVTSAKSNPERGDWDHIRFRSDAVGPDNVLQYVTIEYGGGSRYYGAVNLHDGGSAQLSNCTIRESDNFGLVLSGDSELPTFEDNTIIDNASGAVQTTADRVGDFGPGTYAPNDVDGIFIDSGAVAHDQTWLAHDAPYVAPGGFWIQTDTGSAHLTVAAGAEIHMGDDTRILVQDLGGLTLDGTEQSPVRVRSAKSSGSPGDWEEIRILDTSVDEFNRISYAIIEHGGGGNYGAVRVQTDASLQMDHTTIRAAADFGMLVDNGGELRDFTDNTLTENGGAALTIGANEVDQLGPGTYDGNAIEGIVVDFDWVDHDADWLDHGVPYLASSGLYIGADAGSAVLTLTAGTELLLGDSIEVLVQANGALAAEGTAEDHVRIGSDKAVPAPGDWDELRFRSGSIDARNVLRYTDIEFGGGNAYGMLWVQAEAAVELDNVTFSEPGNGCDVRPDGAVQTAATTYIPCE